MLLLLSCFLSSREPDLTPWLLPPAPPCTTSPPGVPTLPAAPELCLASAGGGGQLPAPTCCPPQIRREDVLFEQLTS